MEQLLLFGPDPPNGGRFRPGEIVRERSPWADPQDVLPYWQVRFATSMFDMYARQARNKHPAWPERKVHARALEEARPYGDPHEIRNYCRAVPHGTFPGDIRWFGDEELVPTGISWRVPTWDELGEWFATDPPRSSEYVLQLNAHTKGAAPGEWRRSFYPPLAGEKDLVALLAGIDPFWAKIQSRNLEVLSRPVDDRTDSSSLSAKPGQRSLFA
jgi:hypothetical protein